jgi:hypothetical protein
MWSPLPKTLMRVNLKQKINPLSEPKNTGDCVQSRDESISTSFEPPLFWLDNIFKTKLVP